MEKDPDGKKPHELGAKLDSGKAPIFRGLLDYFPRALEAVSHVSRAGAAKYAWKGWETVNDGYNRYQDALGRHQIKKAIEGPLDSELLERGEKILHDAQIAWNALAALELWLREQERGLQRTSERYSEEIGLIPKRLPEFSAQNAATECGRDVCAAGAMRGSGGGYGSLCESEAKADTCGQQLSQERAR